MGMHTMNETICTTGITLECVEHVIIIYFGSVKCVPQQNNRILP